MTGARKVRPNVHGLPKHVQVLLAIRSQRHWTQKQLAIAIGVRSETISRWERGNPEPHPMWMQVVARLLTQPVSDDEV